MGRQVTGATSIGQEQTRNLPSKSAAVDSARSASRESLRIAVLFSRLSGYMGACLKALEHEYGAEILVVRYAPAIEAPFEAKTFEWIQRIYDRKSLDRVELEILVSGFRPDALYISGWFDRDYLHVARQMRRLGVPVISGLDRHWTGSPRQRLGQLIAPWYLHSAIDVFWAAGERQRRLASALGYGSSRCWSGVYACDWDRFAAIQNTVSEDRPRAFLYVGRYVPAKGIDVLVDAYRKYRLRARDPWPLLCVGAGAQSALLSNQKGIVDIGFVQPEHLPDLMAKASAFVLPSRHEPWGVVLQEAAAAGLPLVSSDACGATVHLLQDGYNGYLIESENSDHLAEGLETIGRASPRQWSEMSRRSHELSRQFTPHRWAETMVRGLESLHRSRINASQI